MVLEKTFLNEHNREIVPYASPLPPIPDSPRVYLHYGNPGTEAVMKVMQIGAEYVFTREPIQVHVIKNEITVLNELFSIEEIEQKDLDYPLRVLVLDVYKPWLEQRPQTYINRLLNVLRFINADMDRTSAENEKCCERSDERIAKTDQLIIEVRQQIDELDEMLIQQKKDFAEARAQSKKIYEEARRDISEFMTRIKKEQENRLKSAKNTRTNLIKTATVCLMATFFFFHGNSNTIQKLKRLTFSLLHISRGLALRRVLSTFRLFQTLKGPSTIGGSMGQAQLTEEFSLAPHVLSLTKQQEISNSHSLQQPLKISKNKKVYQNKSSQKLFARL